MPKTSESPCILIKFGIKIRVPALGDLEILNDKKNYFLSFSGSGGYKTWRNEKKSIFELIAIL